MYGNDVGAETRDHGQFESAVDDCQRCCLATDGLELGRGMSGAVFRSSHRVDWALKRFFHRTAYEQEKATVLEIIHRIRARDRRLLHKLGLPLAFCDEHCCAVMNLLDPQLELERLLKDDSRRWTLHEARAIAVSLCDTVQALHDLCIFHGDLKAKNINLSPTGPILLDFGLSVLSSTNGLDSDKRCRRLRERDRQQLLQLILQLRFHLPLLTVYEDDLGGNIVRPGLLMFTGDAEDEDERDSRWELSPTVYVLAGDVLDTLMANEDAEDEHCGGEVERARCLVEALFDEDGDASVYAHTADVWAQLGRLTTQLGAHHKELKSMVKQCDQMTEHGCALIKNNLRPAIDAALQRFTRRLRQVLSAPASEAEDALAHVDTAIHRSFTQARALVSSFLAEVSDDHEAANDAAFSQRIDELASGVSRCLGAE